jgi:hypothetical protein
VWGRGSRARARRARFGSRRPGAKMSKVTEHHIHAIAPEVVTGLDSCQNRCRTRGKVRRGWIGA